KKGEATPPPPSAVSVPPPPAPPPEPTTAPVPEAKKDVGTEPVDPPKANLLSPEMTEGASPIRPVSGKEETLPPPPAEARTGTTWSAVPVSEKKEAPKPECPK